MLGPIHEFELPMRILNTPNQASLNIPAMHSKIQKLDFANCLKSTYPVYSSIQEGRSARPDSQ